MSLITTIAELKPHVRVNANIQRLPDIASAESDFLLPILGEDLFEELETAYDGSDDNLTDDQKYLVGLCRAVIAPGAFIKDLPLTQTQLTDGGLVALENEQSRKAFKWEFNNVNEALHAQVYAAQERLISFLKANAEDWENWESSPYNDADDFHIIRDGSELKAVMSLQQPHRCYMMLKPIFRQIAEMTLKDMLGEEQYKSLNTKILAGSLSSPEEWVVRKLRMACAHLAMAMAANTLNIRFGVGGFTIADRYTKDSPEEGRAAASSRQEAEFAAERQKAGDKLLDQVRVYMNANASETVFPLYYASDLYEDPDSASPRIDNSGFTGIFGV